MLNMANGLIFTAKDLASKFNSRPPSDNRPQYTILVEDYEKLLYDYAVWEKRAESFAKNQMTASLYSAFHKFNSVVYKAALYFILVKDRAFLEQVIRNNEPYPLARIEEVVNGIRNVALKAVGNPEPISEKDIGKRVFNNGSDWRNVKNRTGYLVDEDLIEYLDGDEVYSFDEHKTMINHLQNVTEEVIHQGKEKGFLV